MTPTTYDRRAFLRRAGLTGAAAAAVAAGLPRPAAAQDIELAPFLHGVASGDPLADRVILWTRVTPPQGHDGSDIPVTFVVATDPDLQDVVVTGETAATAARDWTVKVDPTGLDPFTYYFFGFTALGRSSLVARTKTAPAAGAGNDHLRFGLVSCSSYQHGYFNAYASLAERDDLDLIVHLGDYIYEYPAGGYGNAEMQGIRDHEPPVEMVALAEYRARHGQYKLDPDLRRLHQLFPFVTTWDDHESTDNSWRDGANNHNPDEPDTPNEAGVPWAQRKADAQRAYDEWMPIRSTGDPAVIYRHLPYGDLADLILLDTRLEGRDEQVEVVLGVEGAGLTLVHAEVSDPDRHIISPTQMSWFQDRLSSATGQWKLVLQQVVVGQWNVGAIPRLGEFAGLPDTPKIIADGGNGLNPDSWDGYTADRDRFLDHLADNGIDDVVVLTGDVHSSWAMDLTKDPSNPLVYNPITGGSVGVEFVVPSVTSGSIAEIAGPFADGQAVVVAGLQAANPHLRWADLKEHGYAILDVTPEHAQADWYFNPTVLEPTSASTHAASWKAEAGTNRLTASTEAAAGAPAPAQPPAAPPSAPTPEPTTDPTATPTTPPTDGGGSLPATGGGAVAAIGAVAAAAALRLRNRTSADADAES